MTGGDLALGSLAPFVIRYDPCNLLTGVATPDLRRRRCSHARHPTARQPLPSDAVAVTDTFQAYTGASRRVTGDLWVGLKVTNADPWSGKNIVQAEFEANVIHSTLNTLKFE